MEKIRQMKIVADRINSLSVSVENITSNIHEIIIPVNDERPHTISLRFKDLKTGKTWVAGMSNDNLMNLIKKDLSFITQNNN